MSDFFVVKVMRHDFSFHTDELTAALDHALSRQPEGTDENNDGDGCGEESVAEEDFVPVT